MAEIWVSYLMCQGMQTKSPTPARTRVSYAMVLESKLLVSAAFQIRLPKTATRFDALFS